MATEVISFTPKQLLLKDYILSNQYRWIGYGGARGGAKSHAVRTIAVLMGLSELGTYSLIFRRLRKELLNNHIHPLFEQFPYLEQYYNKSEMILYDERGKPVVQFGYAESESEIAKFQGTEFDLIFVDEATQCTEKMITFLKTCNRTTKLDFIPKMVLTMNPGGVGHAFIKRIFIDKNYNFGERPRDYVFIQSSVWDNVFWSLPELRNRGISIEDYYSWTDEQRKAFCLAHSEYAHTLESLSPDLRDAFLYGDWEVFGGMFFKHFNKLSEVIEPFQVPRGWQIVGSIDPGFSSPCSFGVQAMDYEGKIYRVATYYETQRSAPEHAEAIDDWLYSPGGISDRYLSKQRIKTIVSGRDAFAKKDRYAITASEKTFSDVFADYGFNLLPASTERIMGWWAMKNIIPHSYFIFNNLNQPLLDEISAAVSDGKYVEDILGKGNNPDLSDHALDEQRYAIMALTKPREYLPDNTPQWAKKIISKRRKKGKGFMSS